MLGRAPIARLLHGLVWRRDVSALCFRYSDGPDLPPAGQNFQPYEVLGHTPAVRNVRVFQFGAEVDPEDWEYHARTTFDRLAPLVEQMPRLEELSIFAFINEADGGLAQMHRLFALPTLTNLRVLRYFHGHSYPLEALANNPALGRLTHLLCYPGHRERREPEGWTTAISHRGVYAVASSPHLRSLTHLQVRCCDGGDDMIADLIDLGVLRRLKVLDLRHGRVTDEGARLLAACPDAGNLQLLDLVNNRLTNRGITTLEGAGVHVRAEDQQTRPYDTRAMFRGDIDYE
jgi:hypothetical protein